MAALTTAAIKEGVDWGALRDRTQKSLLQWQKNPVKNLCLERTICYNGKPRGHGEEKKWVWSFSGKAGYE
jgi:hypothetical protein